MKIGDYEFVCTCSACPEQYDVFDKDGTIGKFKEEHNYAD
jgi:hypothetical protein